MGKKCCNNNDKTSGCEAWNNDQMSCEEASCTWSPTGCGGGAGGGGGKCTGDSPHCAMSTTKEECNAYQGTCKWKDDDKKWLLILLIVIGCLAAALLLWAAFHHTVRSHHREGSVDPYHLADDH